MRMRKKPNLIPRMERCAAVQILEPEALKGRWLVEFPGYKELHVELGCGKGRFTAGMAELYPQVLFVAVERVPDAMVVAMERVTNQGLNNVRFIDADASRLCDLFAEKEADRIYVNFCDPWPRPRHAKRRLISPGFLKIYSSVLKAGGEIHFKTDNAPLFEYALETFPGCGYRLSETTSDLHTDGICGVMTDYEAKFHADGVPIKRCVATKE